jgi:hypothetical protein
MSLFDDFSNTLSSTVNAATSTISNDVNGVVNTVSSAVSSIPQGVANLSVTTLTNLGNAAASRLSASGLSSIAGSLTSPSVGFSIAGDLSGVTPSNDWRVKLSLPPSAGIFYQSTNPGIQWPLQQTGGVIFPYTPTVNITHSASYDGTALTHSNYMNFFYKSSYVQNIQITGEFTVQNVNEGLYLIGVIEFFRSCTKMFFGQDALAGNPPPVLNLNGYGATYLPNVPVVVESFSHTMNPDVDYINIPYISPNSVASTIGSLITNNALSTRMPTTSQITVTLLPVYSRASVHNQFTLTQFAAGNLLAGNGNFI